MSKSKALALVERHNVRTTRDGGFLRVDYHLDSPPGYVFAAGYTHTITGGYEEGSGGAPAMWRHFVTYLELGLAECDTPGCDLCADEERQRGYAWLSENTAMRMSDGAEWRVSRAAMRLPIDDLVPVLVHGHTVYMTREEATA